MLKRCLSLATLSFFALTLFGCSDAATDPANGEGEDEVAGTPCAGISAKAVSADARQFMVRERMILPAEETNKSGVTAKWAAIGRVANEGTCLVVMNLVTTAFGAETESDTYEVIAAQKTGTKVSFRKFDDTRKVPATVRVGIGVNEAVRDPDGKILWDVLYYVELSGADALAVAKTVAAGLEKKVGGLSAEISATNVRTVNHKLQGTPDGRLSWDPTPGRRWKLKNAKFSLRRGMTPEIADVQPWQIDEDFAGYFSGSGGTVAPWASAFLRRIQVGSEWKDLIPYREPPGNP